MILSILLTVATPYVYIALVFMYFEKDYSCLCISRKMTHVYVCLQTTRVYVLFFFVFQERRLVSMYVYKWLASIYFKWWLVSMYLFFLYFKKDDSCLCTSTNDSYLYISSDDWCLCIFLFFVFQKRWLVSMYVYKWLVSIYFKWWLVSMDWCLCKIFCITVPKGPLGGASP